MKIKTETNKKRDIKIRRINVFTPDKVFEAVKNEKESYFLELSKGWDGIRYEVVFKIAKRMKKYWGSNPEKRKMPGIILIQEEEDGDELYEKIYRLWHEFRNIKEYVNDYPFILKHKIGENIKTVRNDGKGKEIKNKVAISFFKQNRKKENKSEFRLWLGDEKANTEIKIINQTVEKYYKIKNEPWLLKYKNRLLNELDSEEEIKEGRFIKLEVTKRKKEDSEKPSTVSQEKKEVKQATPTIPDKFLKIAEENQILILLGEAGSGKTTTLRHYFDKCLTKLNENTPGLKIPVFIRLKRFKEHKIEPLKETLSNFILTSINDKLDEYSKISKEEININHDCLLLFDGLDEITDSNIRNAAILQLQDLLINIEVVNGSEVIISCRSNDYHNNFKQHPAYELEELEDDQIKGYLTDFLKKGVDVKTIYKKQFEGNLRILDMARNPFLLYVIACIINENLKDDPGNSRTLPLPQNKGALLEIFVNKICSDDTKETVNTKEVPPSQKYRLLSMFAFEMLNIGDRGEYTCPANARSEVEDKYFQKTGTTAIQITKILLKVEKERLLKSGSAYGEFEFIHSLIRDYFAAYYLKQLSKQDLLKIIQSELLEYTKWDDAISLLVGIVDDDDSSKIINLLTDLAPFFAAQCLPMAKYVSSEAKDKLINILNEKSEHHNISPIREDSLAALINMESETATEFVFKIIESDDLLAITALCKNKSEKTAEPLLKLLQRYENDNILISLIGTLGMITSEKAVMPLVKLMEKTEEKEVLNTITRTLLNINSDKVVDPLFELMKVCKNQDTLRCIAVILKYKVSKKDVEPLVGLIERCKSEEALCSAICTLGETKSGKAVKPLVGLMEKYKSKVVFKCILNSLGKIKTERAFEFLVELAETNYTEETLDCLATALVNTGRKKAVESIIEIMKRCKSEDTLCSVILTLGETKSGKAIKPLIELMEKYKNVDILDSIVRALLKIESDKVVELFIELMKKSKHEDTLRFVAFALGEIKSDKAIESLIEIIEKSKTEFVLKYVISALANIKSDKAVEPLVELLERYESENILLQVIKALSIIKSEKAVKPLIELMKRSKSEETIQDTVGALGVMGAKEAAEPIIELMKSYKSEYVPFYIVSALGKIGAEEAVKPLIEIMNSCKDVYIIQKIVQALGNIKSQKAVEPLIKLLERSDNNDVLESVIVALFMIKSEKTEEPLIELLERSDNTRVFINAIISLSDMKSEKSVESLFNLMRRSVEDFVFGSALHAIIIISENKCEELIKRLIMLYWKSKDTDPRKGIIYKSIEEIKEKSGRRFLKQLKGFP